MLQDYPSAVQYSKAKEIDRLARKLPATKEEILLELAGLLPLLGDELVPVWVSETLPSQPVALVSFFDKSGEPLVAVVCESGLLWVAHAADPEVRAALLIPEVGPGGGRVQGLFACQVLRPFGQWTELLLPVTPPSSAGAAEQEAIVYRALVSFQVGRVQLELAVEDADRDQNRKSTSLPPEWRPLPLPDRYRYLLSHTEVFSGGVDALTLEGEFSGSSPEGEATLRLWGRYRSLEVEGRTRLVLQEEEDRREVFPLPHPVKSGVVVPDSPSQNALRIVLAQEGRRLQGLVFNEEVTSSWHQRLQYEPVAIDCSLEIPPVGKWPDLFIALDDRHVVRFGWRGAVSLDRLWSRLVEHLGKVAKLSTPADWTAWTSQVFKHLQESRSDDQGRALRRALHYLAADRALSAAAGEDLNVEEVRKNLVGQVSEEVEADLLLPAARRLLEALQVWEKAPCDRVPDLVWAFYEKVPFSIQELFDSHLRSGTGKTLRSLNEGYNELLNHAPNVLTTHQDLKDLVRDVGIKLLQAFEAYATASMIPPRKSFRFRHMVHLEIGGQSVLAAVGAHEIRLYRVRPPGKGEIGLEEVEVAHTDLGDLFTAQFAKAIDLGHDRATVLLGSLQGELAVWDPTQAILTGEAPDLGRKKIGGSLSAAAALEWEASQPGGRALVAQNLQGARLLRVLVKPDGELEIEAEIETGLKWIQSLQTLAHGGRSLLALGAGEDLILLSGNQSPGQAAVPLASFPLGAAVIVVACLPSEERRTLVTACTREGQVFCVELGTEPRPWRKFSWIYQVPRGASGVLSRVGSQVPLGVISTQGTVTLLSSSGDLVLDYRPHDPVDAGILLSVRGETWLVVGRQSGGLTVLLANRGPEQALRRARQQLANIPADTIGPRPPDNEAGELGWLFARFEQDDDLCDLYDLLDFEISRAELVHLASRALRRVQPRAREWVERLSFRDLADFLLRLSSKKASEWILQSWERLLGSSASDQPRERGLEDEGMALYELLRHSRREERVIPVERLRSLPGVLLESDWISYLVAQYLVEGVGEKFRTSARILPPLLAALGLFPLKVTRAAATIAAGSENLKEVAQVLDALVELGEVIARKGQAYEIQASFKHLAKTLEPWREEPRKSGLFARLVRFVYDPDLDSDGTRRTWPRLLDLLVEVRQPTEEPSVLQRRLFSPLANLLPSPPPVSDARLSEEAVWLQATRERAQIFQRLLEEADQQSDETLAEEVWKPVYDEIVKRSRERLLQLSTEALDELRTQVRIHLRQRGTRYLSPQLIELEIEAQTETLKRASNVRFVIALDESGGLASVGKSLVFREEVALLDQPQEFLFSCEGRLAPGQTEVRTQITVQHGDHRPFKTSISLRLPPYPISSLTGRAPFPDALASRGHELAGELRRAKKGCRFILLDESLGRSHLLRRVEGPGIRRVDLDSALKELGPGRAYPTLLTLGNIFAALRGEQVPSIGEMASASPAEVDLGPGDQILVAPCDDFWERLLADSSLHEVLNSFLTFLGGYRGRSLTFVMDSGLGARLRQHQRRRLDWIRAYRLEVHDTFLESASGKEAAQWFVGEAGSLSSDRLGGSALQRLGGDLRLGLQFRQLSRGQDLATGTLEEILGGMLQSTPALEVLRADLVGLPPEAVHLLIVAACSQTTFRFGEVAQGLLAAETVFSTVPGGRKGRQVSTEGQRIDAHALEGLRSDRDAKARTLAVAGYSRRRTSWTEGSIEHLSLFLGTDAEVERMGKLLEEIGAVEMHEGVILARSPYRELIRDAVRQGKPPAEVYQLLSGGPSPLAAWSLPLFARLTADKIQQIDTRISGAQASMLQLLGASWHALTERRSFPETQLRRALYTLTGREVEWVAGSGKISDRVPRWKGDNWDLLFGLDEPQRQRGTPFYFLILAPVEEGQPELEPALPLLEALTKAGSRSEGLDGDDKNQAHSSLLLVARPGGRSIRNRERRWIELSDEDLRTAALNPEWVKAFWGLVKTRAGLKALAPFKREGALPPGSPVFAGREDELNYMLRHLRQRSFLIVGSRQVGKTSLLNELRFRLQKEQNKREIACFYMDLQGVRHSNELTGNLLDWSGSSDFGGLRSRELFTHLVEATFKESRFPVFLLNEIDVLLKEDASFLGFLRGLHDASRAQFVMTGYTQAAAACQDPNSPFYHWTTSPDRTRKYLALAELTPRAAEQIIEVLERSPLELVWDSPQEKLKGQRLILDRSYRIPHLIQAICLGLVERLEESGRYNLRYDDVITVVNQREISAWDRVLSIDYSFAAPNLLPQELARALVQLVLHTAMKNLYFSGPRPLIEDPLLPSRDASTVSFSAEEVHRWLPQNLKGLLIASELAEANKLIDQVDIDAMLSALTLTLVLSYDLKTGRYFFPGHLYPRELQRDLRPGELIEDRIIGRVLNFAYHLPAPGLSKPVLPAPTREGNAT